MVSVEQVSDTSLARRIQDVLGRMEAAAERSGRSPSDISLLAVSKTKPVSMIIEAARTGLVSHFGENHVQEGQVKVPAIPDDLNVVWHLIGHLQRNKVRKAVEYFNIIESIDREEIASSIERVCSEKSVNINVLIEANSSGEMSKTGAPMEHVPYLADFIREKCPHLTLRGLMTIGPLYGNELEVKKAFDATRELRDRIEVCPGELPVLSMGMSGDYEWAIEHGSTQVRVGSAIFGAR